MLLAMLQQNPDSPWLETILNVELLTTTIAEFSGKTLSMLGPESYLLPELDFLALGCEKART